MKYFITEPKYVLNELTTSISLENRKEFDTLKEHGYVIIEDYLSPSECEVLRAEIDHHIDQKYAWTDKQGSDKRVYGIEDVSEPFKGLFRRDLLNAVYNKYISNRNREEFIMTNKIQFKENNLGSGGGWHRDSLNRRQLKFILYLSDVDINTGCFQYIQNTHNVYQKLKINNKLNKEISAYRYSEEDIDKLVEDGYKINDLTGKAGTLIIVETSGIHRGRPLVEGGVRYAATSYLSETKHSSKLLSELAINKKS